MPAETKPPLPKHMQEEELLNRYAVRLDATSTGVVCGLIAGCVLLAATLWLVALGGPDPGPHLGLLSNYFPGYSVSLTGSFLGFLYAFVVGAVSGYTLARLYNYFAR